jgi:glycosyltransferase involved in cell wall biosynthesis
VLLRELLAARWPASRLTAILDCRGRASLGDVGCAIDIHWVEPNLLGRWRAEKRLATLTRSGEAALCFHNLPPVLARKAQVFCYVQNAYVIGLIATDRLGMRVRVRILLERLLAYRLRHRVRRYLVQTPTMADAVGRWYGANPPPVDVLPFVSTDLVSAVKADHTASVSIVSSERLVREWDFIYVSDGSFHKNHHNLLAAWQLLADQNVRPSLVVTLHPQRDAMLRETVQDLVSQGLQIVDLGQVTHAEILAAYHRSAALIFPSYAESFGIPLIEARAAGLPILASERDYVRDVCEPVETFDPSSPQSIARAVRRFLGDPAETEVPLSAQFFADQLCDLAIADKARLAFYPAIGQGDARS